MRFEQKPKPTLHMCTLEAILHEATTLTEIQSQLEPVVRCLVGVLQLQKEKVEAHIPYVERM
jgi:hypothetical protein